MSITKRNPNTIYLGGGDGPGGESGCTVINDYVAIESITPGMLIEYHDDSGAQKWGVHDSADDDVQLVVALDQPMLNKGIDDAYAAGDLLQAGQLRPGSVFYGIIPSGQDITFGATLQSNGDGRLKAKASGAGRFKALETTGAVLEDTRLRVECI